MRLRQSTAVVIPFGPFVDSADGKTLKTGLVSALDHASTGIMLSKSGGTLAVRHATVTASTYDAHGCYKVTLDTTDVGTCGQLRVIYTDAATCLPVWIDYEVVQANAYDADVLGTEYRTVDTYEQKFGITGATLQPKKPGGTDTSYSRALGTAAVNPIVSSS